MKQKNLQYLRKAPMLVRKGGLRYNLEQTVI